MGYKILLADDDRDLLEMLGRYFEMKGYQILQAGNGTEAVRMSAEEPDLILLDINMPGMDGGMSKDPRAGILPDFIFDRESGGAGPGEWSDDGWG